MPLPRSGVLRALLGAVLVVSGVVLSAACRSTPPPAAEPTGTGSRPASPKGKAPGPPQPCAACHPQHAKEMAPSRKFVSAVAVAADSGTPTPFGVIHPLAAAGHPPGADGCLRCHPAPSAQASFAEDGRCLGCHAMALPPGRRKLQLRSRRSSRACAYPVVAHASFASPALCQECHASSHRPGDGAHERWLETEYPGHQMACADCHMEKTDATPAGHAFAVHSADWLSRSLELTAKLLPGGRLEVQAENGGAGHLVPPETCELRQLAVEVRFFKEGRELSSRTLMRFGCELRRSDGVAAFHFEPHTVAWDDRLKANERRTATVSPPRGWTRASVRFLFHTLPPPLSERLGPAPRTPGTAPTPFGEVTVSRAPSP